MGEKKKLNINKETIKNLKTRTSIKTGATTACNTVNCGSLFETAGCPYTVTITGTLGDTKNCNQNNYC